MVKKDQPPTEFACSPAAAGSDYQARRCRITCSAAWVYSQEDRAYEPLAEDVRYDIWWRVEAGYQSREEIIAAVVQNWSESIWWVEAAHQSQEEAYAAIEANWCSRRPAGTNRIRLRHATEELIARHLCEKRHGQR